MLKVVNGGAPKTRKLILGFDAGCGTCADLAAGVQERVGNKLEVQNLSDPQLMAWREEALGKDAKWTPTLFEVEGEKVLKAWAGWRMGYALSRKLGPSSTWQVMQALGEVGGAPKIEESPIVEKLPEKAAEAVKGISRGKFLKGVGGAALAMTALSGTNLLASPAAAATRNPYDVVKARRISGTALARLARATARNTDVRNVAGITLSTTTKIRNSKPQAFVTTLRNGISITSIVYTVSSDRRIAHYQLSRVVKPGGSRSVAKVWVTRQKANILVKASEGGHLWRIASTSKRPQAAGVAPLAECPPVTTGGRVPPVGADCREVRRECCSWEFSTNCALGLVGAGATCTTCGVGVVGSALTAIPTVGGSVAAGAVLIGATCVGCATTAALSYRSCCKSWRPVYKCGYNA